MFDIKNTGDYSKDDHPYFLYFIFYSSLFSENNT